MNDEEKARNEKCRKCERRIEIAKWRDMHWLGWEDCPLKCENKPKEEGKTEE